MGRVLLTREGAYLLTAKYRYAYCDWSRDPIYSGCGRCPWRLIISDLVSNLASSRVARKLIPALFEKWPDAKSLRYSLRGELALLLLPIARGHERARKILRFNRAWLKDDWKTVLDLPYIKKYVVDAIQVYCCKLPGKELE